MNRLKYSMLICIGMLPLSVQASDPALQCTLLKDNALRLACFDKVYAAQFPPQSLPQTPKPQPKSVDLVKSIESSIDNKETVVVFDGARKAGEPLSDLIESADAYTPLSQLYDLDENNQNGILSLREHNPMYILPVWYNSAPNVKPYSSTRGETDAEKFSDQKRIETKLQISFKTKIMEDLFRTRADIWFGYTQKSDWQVWNQGRKSTPFRNSDYMPELLVTQPVKADLPFGGKLRVLGAGIVHQSNGQSRPESRSWNRVYGMAGMEWGKLTVVPRVWMRAFDMSGEKDDNPDIMDYMGYGDLKLQYRFNDQQTLGTTLRYNPKTGKGAIETGYAFPVKGKLKAYVRSFHGYGESLIDYNHKQSGIGIGVMFNDWDGF
ncbi:phospholipase A [Neisseria wadsworthii]|uniref:Phospholipase A1 n=1 Tax=Neisseria wadsworthii 9715 TaxID=1030841 RepID=G4CQS5_9NEIS|nr:phospholipase A1 [Neisseria wadsworthii 9715]QMT35165.1 phospholipase A [Neisseria wadsworthii]